MADSSFIRRADGAYFTRSELAELAERQSVEIATLKAQNATLTAAIEQQAESVDYSALEAPSDEP